MEVTCFLPHKTLLDWNLVFRKEKRKCFPEMSAANGNGQGIYAYKVVL